jgi:glucose-6-phosphate isomerase
MIKRHLNRRYPLDLDAWKSLKAHYLSDLKNTTIPSLFQSEGNRASDLLLEAAELKLDYSKNLLNNETLKLFAMLLKEAKVKESVERMFSGENINASEKKPALHMALRSKLSDQIALNIEGVDNVWSTQEKDGGFCFCLAFR